MYTLLNFEKQIDEAILKKGKAYFKDDLVDNLEENNNIWTAEVEGNDTYNVEIKINNSNEIETTFCDCPHDVYSCKHVVAVLFAIQKELKTKIESPEKNQKKDIFENLLQNISLQEYQTFIRHLAKNNKGFKTDFELHFADKDDRIDLALKYKEIIKKTIKKYTKHGFIDYYSTSSFINEIDKIIQVANEFNTKNNVKDSFEIAKTLLAEIVETVEYSDDSNGYIGEAIDEIIDIIGVISDRNDIAVELKEQIFNYCGSQLNKSVYFEYGDFGQNLLGIYYKLAIQLNLSEAFLSQIDSILKKSKDDSYLATYLLKIKLDFFDQTGREDLAKDLVESNMHIVEIRQNLVNKAMASKDYKKAKELITEGIKIAEKKDQPGTVNQWKHLILDIAYLEKDTKTIKQLTKYFAFDRGTNVEYYNKWKKTFSKEEWTVEIENYISETIIKVTKEWNSRKGMWRSERPSILHALAQIYVEEKYYDRILPLIQEENDLNTTLEFQEFLKKDYSNELISLYLPAIKIFAARANDRNAYADMVRKMKKIIKDIPASKQEIMLLAAALKMQYSVKPRRPAMIDELNKLF